MGFFGIKQGETLCVYFFDASWWFTHLTSFFLSSDQLTCLLQSKCDMIITQVLHQLLYLNHHDHTKQYKCLECQRIFFLSNCQILKQYIKGIRCQIHVHFFQLKSLHLIYNILKHTINCKMETTKKKSEKHECIRIPFYLILHTYLNGGTEHIFP